MKFEIRHDPEIYLAESIKKWNVTWGKKLSNNRFSLVLALIFLAIFILIANSLGAMAMSFIVIDLFFVFISLNVFSSHKKQKREYILNVREISDSFKNSRATTTYEFEEEYFGFSDFQVMVKINWIAVSHYYVKDNVIYLKLKLRTDDYSISESIIGPENYRQVLEFISQKVKG